MNRTDATTGAWGGVPMRKQAAIETARAALAAGQRVTFGASLRLAPAEQRDVASNLYCAAYGTANPEELEARSGLPASVLLLASVALAACEYWVRDVEAELETQRARLVAAGLAALEALPAGAEADAIARSYLVKLLGWLAGLRDPDGRALSSGQQALIRELAAMHASGGSDSSAFRALRRSATAATDAAAGDLEGAVLRFVESVAWPLTGLSAELPQLVSLLHFELRSYLGPERPSPSERAALDAVSDLYRKIDAQLDADPSLDARVLYAQVNASPESAVVNASAFQARLQHYDRVAAEAYAPVIIELLLEAFRKA